MTHESIWLDFAKRKRKTEAKKPLDEEMKGKL